MPINNPWHEYEREKKRIAEIAQSSEEYQRLINELCEKLGL